jgi:hypothetical protein
MGKYAVHQTDKNAPELRQEAERLGLKVYPIGRPVDWLVVGYGLVVACEVKTAKGKLRPDQVAFLQAAGLGGRVLRTKSDVRNLWNDMQHDGPEPL